MSGGRALEARRERYFALSTRLAQLDDRRLRALLRQSEPRRGWGTTRTIEIDGHRVFAKSIPLTERELANAYSTKNLYQLPTFYNYGVGSAGFGAFRELAAHVKTTNWVLSGAIETFPLTYHHRILRSPDRARVIKGSRLDRYARYWNGSKRIRRYIEERQRARHVVVVLLEHWPAVLSEWLPGHMRHLDRVIADMQRTIDFMRDRGVIHFDVHQSNIVLDGARPRLGDFGLVLDREFELSAEERDFHARHLHYDHGEFLYSLLLPLVDAVRALGPEATRELERRHGSTELEVLLGELESVAEGGVPRLGRRYVEVLLQHRPVMLEMGRVFRALGEGSKSTAIYDDARLRRLLRRARASE